MIGFLLAAAAAAAQPSPPPTPTPTPAFSLGVLKGQGGTPPPRGSSLGEVAKGIKLRLPPGEKSLTITNANLPELSKGAVLTSGAPAPVRLSPPGAVAQEEELRAIWQERYQQARGYVLFLEQRESSLQADVKRLERQFYAEDDPAYRDGVIKPEWDQALEDLKKTQDALATSRSLPDNVRNEAMQNGAVPGWFRGLPDPAPVSSPPPSAAGPAKSSSDESPTS